MARDTSDAVFSALTHSGSDPGGLFAVQLAQDPASIGDGFNPSLTGAPVHDTVDTWTNVVRRGRGPSRPLAMLYHGRFNVDERFGATRLGCSGGSKMFGATKPPCGNGCGTYCAEQTELPDRPHLQPPETVAFRADPGGWSVAADGTTCCECGTAQTGGGPGLYGAPSAGLGDGGPIPPTSVFALAMQWPNTEWLTKRLVRAGIVLPPPTPLRVCSKSRAPCLCSWIGPYLARQYRDCVADWRTQPMQVFNDVGAGLNLLNEQFESKLLGALYGQAAWRSFQEYDRRAGGRKYLGELPRTERNVRGGQAVEPPHLLAGNYYRPVNGESGAISRTLSGPSRIYQNAMFQATGVRVGMPSSMPQTQTGPQWPMLLAGGASLPNSARAVLAAQTPTVRDTVQGVAGAAEARGTSCTPPWVNDSGTPDGLVAGPDAPPLAPPGLSAAPMSAQQQAALAAARQGLVKGRCGGPTCASSSTAASLPLTPPAGGTGRASGRRRPPPPGAIAVQ